MLRLLTTKVLTLKVSSLKLLILSFIITLSFNGLALANLSFQTGKDQEKSETNNSWINDLSRQADQLIKDHQTEAKAIVEKATHAQGKHCEVAQDIADQSHERVRASLGKNEDKHDSIYPSLLVFVSFSIPLETLKVLGTQVNQMGGKLVLRGLIGAHPTGSFKEAIEKLKELQTEVIIDPLLFETFNVKVVPTFVLRQERSKSFHETGTYDRLQGNVSLTHALEQFASHGNNEAKALLQRLRSAP